MMNTAEKIRFGNYLLHERIGAGGMAEIFLASDPTRKDERRALVIKRILPQLSEDDQFVRMFVEEARLCVSLKHDNIVRVFDLGEIDHQYFIAMEYVHGRDLLKTLAACARKRIAFPTDLALYIVMEVLQGLDYAHKLRRPDGEPLGLIHRDVSPSNVLLSFDGQVKLGDFGIAKASTREKTAAGILKGKFGYMAPEQVMGRPIDHRADIFAVGIMLYELLTGHRLFAGRNDLAVLEKVKDARIEPPIRQYRPDLAQELEAIAMRALSRRAEDRFQSTDELHRALAAYTQKKGVRVTSRRLSRFLHDLFLNEETQEQFSTKPAAKPAEDLRSKTTNERGPLEVIDTHTIEEPGAAAFFDEDTSNEDSELSAVQPLGEISESTDESTALEVLELSTAQAGEFGDIEETVGVDHADPALAKSPAQEVREIRRMAEEEHGETELDLDEQKAAAELAKAKTPTPYGGVPLVSGDTDPTELPIDFSHPPIEDVSDEGGSTELLEPSADDLAFLSDDDLREAGPSEVVPLEGQEATNESFQPSELIYEESLETSSAMLPDSPFDGFERARTAADIDPSLTNSVDREVLDLTADAFSSSTSRAIDAPLEEIDDTTAADPIDSLDLARAAQAPDPLERRQKISVVNHARRRASSRAVVPTESEESDLAESTRLGELVGTGLDALLAGPASPQIKAPMGGATRRNSSGITAALTEAAAMEAELEEIRSMSVIEAPELSLAPGGQLSNLVSPSPLPREDSFEEDEATVNADDVEESTANFGDVESTMDRTSGSREIAPALKQPGRLGDEGASDLFGALELIDSGPLDLSRVGPSFDPDDEASLEATGVGPNPMSRASTRALSSAPMGGNTPARDPAVHDVLEEATDNLEEPKSPKRGFTPIVPDESGSIAYEATAYGPVVRGGSLPPEPPEASAELDALRLEGTDESEARLPNLGLDEEGTPSESVDALGRAHSRADSADGLISGSFDLSDFDPSSPDAHAHEATGLEEAPARISSPPTGARSVPPPGLQNRMRAIVERSIAAKEVRRSDPPEEPRTPPPRMAATKTNFQPLADPAVPPRASVPPRPSVPIRPSPVVSRPPSPLMPTPSVGRPQITQTSPTWRITIAACVIAAVAAFAVVVVFVAKRGVSLDPSEWFSSKPAPKQILPNPTPPPTEPAKKQAPPPAPKQAIEKVEPKSEAIGARGTSPDPKLTAPKEAALPAKPTPAPIVSSKPPPEPKKVVAKPEPKKVVAKPEPKKVAPKPKPKPEPKKVVAKPEPKKVAPKPKPKPEPKKVVAKATPKRSGQTGIRAECRQPVTVYIRGKGKRTDVTRQIIELAPGTYSLRILRGGENRSYNVRVLEGELADLPCLD